MQGERVGGLRVKPLLFDELQRRAYTDPGRAIVDAQGVHSWSSLLDRAEHFARQLPFECRLALVMTQSADAIALLAAADRVDADVIVFSALYGDDRSRRHAAEVGAGAFVFLENGSLRIESLGGGVSAREAGVGVLTSGTSGRPKCVRHYWGTLTASVRRGGRYEGTRFFCGHPLAQFGGLQVLAQAVFGRGVLHVARNFAPHTAIEALTQHGADCLCATPTYVRQLLLAGGADTLRAAGLRAVTLGGEIADQGVLDTLRTVLPAAAITHIYASTELGVVFTVRDGRAGFDASLVDGRRLRIVDGVLHGRRSPGSTPRDTECGAPGDADWLSTGDLVEIVDDRVHFRGRASDIFSVGGSKVNPIEIEAVVRDVPGVADVVVRGCRSSIVGAMPKAIVRAEPGTDCRLLEQAIARHCSARLPSHMVPRLFEFREAIEASTSQKTVRGESRW
jgi:acyl-CoA synthetase (AMP-forming)/AMP-acid ligase II